MSRLPLGLAAGALLGSTGLVGWSLLRAFTIDTLPRPAWVSSQPGTVRIGSQRPLPAARLAGAVGKDPFHPERRRPAVRFRLPGESRPGAADSTSARVPFKLIGTAAMPKGKGFAMCQWGEEQPRLVRIGETVGDLTLKGVTPGRAVFLTSGGERFEVQVPKAGS